MFKLKEIALTDEQRENLTKIWQYIKDTYPNSTLATDYHTEVSANGGTIPVDAIPNRYLLDMCYNFFRIDVLHMTNCSCPENIMTAIRNYLGIVAYRCTEGCDPMKSREIMEMMRMWFNVDLETDNPLLQFLALTLNRAGLTKIAGGVGPIYHAQTTDLGRMCKYVIHLKLTKDSSDKDEEEGDIAGSTHTDPSSGETRTTTSQMNPDSTEPETSDSHTRFHESIKYFLNYLESYKTTVAVPLPIGALDYDGDPDACVTEARSLWVTLVCMFGESVNGKAEYGYINEVEAAIGYLTLMESTMNEVMEARHGKE